MLVLPFMLVTLPLVFLLACWIARLMMRRRFERAEPGDPAFDVSELLRLRASGQIDEATFERLRDRFAARRGDGPGGPRRGFEPVLRAEEGSDEPRHDAP